MNNVTPLESAGKLNQGLVNKALNAMLSAYAAMLCLGILIGVFIMITVVYFKTVEDMLEDHADEINRIISTHADVIRDYKEETELSQIYYAKAEVALDQCTRRLEDGE